MSQYDWPAQDYAIGSFIQNTTADMFLGSLQLDEATSVLDIGCGNGAYTTNILKRVPKGSVLGIDSSESMLALAQELISTYSNFQLQQCDAETMSFDGKFDQVVSFWCLQWTHDIVKAFANIYRALKPGGHVLTLFPAGDDPFINNYQKVRGSGDFACLEGFIPPMEYSQMQDLDSKLASLPFTNISVKNHHQSLTLPSIDTYRKFVNGIAFYQGQLSDEDRLAVNAAMVDVFDQECRERHQGAYVFDMHVYCITAEK